MGAGPEARLFPPHCPPTDSVEDEFELSTVCHRPEGLEQLQEQTKFTRKELQVLYRGFKNVSAKPGPTGREVGQEWEGHPRLLLRVAWRLWGVSGEMMGRDSSPPPTYQTSIWRFWPV